MTLREKHDQRLLHNKLNRIENRLRRLEVLIIKNVATDKKIKKEILSVEKEEKSIEKEQKKLESEETEILSDIKRLEAEEEWHLDVQYSCTSKILGNQNIITCSKTNKLCEIKICPIWKK